MPVAFFYLGALGKGGHENNRDTRQFRARLYRVGELEPIPIRHRDISKD